jgi:hypothetical protein
VLKLKHTHIISKNNLKKKHCSMIRKILLHSIRDGKTLKEKISGKDFSFLLFSFFFFYFFYNSAPSIDVGYLYWHTFGNIFQLNWMIVLKTNGTYRKIYLKCLILCQKNVFAKFLQQFSIHFFLTSLISFGNTIWVDLWNCQLEVESALTLSLRILINWNEHF